MAEKDNPHPYEGLPDKHIHTDNNGTLIQAKVCESEVKFRVMFGGRWRSGSYQVEQLKKMLTGSPGAKQITLTVDGARCKLPPKKLKDLIG